MKTYHGGCHCKAVRFEVDVDLSDTLECNCSHCHMKGLILAFVDNDFFRLLRGDDSLTSYTFGKGSIDHLFCRHCGTQSYAKGKSFLKTAINVRCLDDVDTTSLSPKKFNGRDL